MQPSDKDEKKSIKHTKNETSLVTNSLFCCINPNKAMVGCLALAGAVLFPPIAGVSAAASVPIGAAILEASGYDGYENIGEMIKLASVGQIILGFPVGLLSAVIIRGLGSEEKHSAAVLAVYLLFAIPAMLTMIVAGDALGQAIFDSDAELDKVWAANLLGLAILSAPSLLIALCLFASISALSKLTAKALPNSQDESMETTENTQSQTP